MRIVLKQKDFFISPVPGLRKQRTPGPTNLGIPTWRISSSILGPSLYTEPCQSCRRAQFLGQGARLDWDRPKESK
jgi:hypothetical protein